MSNIAGALYRVTKIANEMKYSRGMKSVSRQCQFKQPCLQAAPAIDGERPPIINIAQNLSNETDTAFHRWERCGE